MTEQTTTAGPQQPDDRAGAVLSSILIPVYNQDPHILRACLLSAKQQTVPVEIIVVDDGSDPDHEDLVDAVLGGYSNQKSGARALYMYQHNGGVASALNQALRYAQGDYIQWLSSDDVFRDTKTAEQMGAMEREGAKVSYCAYEDGLPMPFSTWPAAQYPTQKTFMDALRQHCFINACSVMWHRSVFDEVGPWDERIRHAQDGEFILRCAEKHNFLAVNRPLLRRRSHTGQMSNRLQDPDELVKKQKDIAYVNKRYGARWGVYVPE